MLARGPLCTLQLSSTQPTPDSAAPRVYIASIYHPSFAAGSIREARARASELAREGFYRKAWPVHSGDEKHSEFSIFPHANATAHLFTQCHHGGIVPPNSVRPIRGTAVERERGRAYRFARSVLRQPLWVCTAATAVFATATQQTPSATDKNTSRRRNGSFLRFIAALLAFLRWHCPCCCCCSTRPWEIK